MLTISTIVLTVGLLAVITGIYLINHEDSWAFGMTLFGVITLFIGTTWFVQEMVSGWSKQMEVCSTEAIYQKGEKVFLTGTNWEVSIDSVRCLDPQEKIREYTVLTPSGLMLEVHEVNLKKVPELKD